MEHWTEIRTAAHVARLGTVSAAAEALGVHRATVNRHVDMLESILGGKLFQRHARGFTPTDLGRDLLRIAESAGEQFEELHRRAQQQSSLQGEFIVTSVATFGDTLLPILRSFGEKHPDLTIRFLPGESLFRLEYGEAHIAFRAGEKPQNPDNIVREFKKIEVGLYAHQSYVEKYGLPQGPYDYGHHRFVASDTPSPRAKFLRWIEDNVPKEAIRFRSNSIPALAAAVLCGTGIGFLYHGLTNDREDLVRVMPPLPDWTSSIWMVTHVDVHRSTKVQAFLKEIREFWPDGVPADRP